MFPLRKRPTIEPKRPPGAMEWWTRSIGSQDRTDEIGVLMARLRTGIERAAACECPVFLRLLGRDLERELEALSITRRTGLGDSTTEPMNRYAHLEDLVDYYCDAVTPWSKATRAIELSDAVREAVAGLSGDLTLVLRVEGEPSIVASRRALIALCEVTIRAATPSVDQDVEVVLPRCANTDAELRVMWTPAEVSDVNTREGSRFLALALAYALKLKATVRRIRGAQDGLVVRIPVNQAGGKDMSVNLCFDSEVVADATAFCLEG